MRTGRPGFGTNCCSCRGSARREDDLPVVEEDRFSDLQRYRDATVHDLPYGVRKIIEPARACAPGLS